MDAEEDEDLDPGGDGAEAGDAQQQQNQRGVYTLNATNRSVSIRNHSFPTNRIPCSLITHLCNILWTHENLTSQVQLMPDLFYSWES